MHGPTMSGWLLVALCGVTSAYCLLRMRSGPREERGVARGEALMGLGMAVMAVPAAVFAPPRWSGAVYVVVFGAAALRALWWARAGAGGPHHSTGAGSSHHVHHLIGSAAMVYMAVAMAAPGGGHTGHGAGAQAGGVPLLTGALLVYYAVYVLWVGARLLPVPAAASASGGTVSWGSRPELALACRLSMALGMLTMLLTL
ncbi:DUF5134 domain-containing protein [Streptomyces sp. NBC_00237]|uniref:DUF5134 domain-containing protein n=1 Tax=Streptomyces sp. NBC_00237 TaxID=2975687 RepID=UPI0022525A90|nr:DUF5134 domain-containing protein [Streptomyces sp. NBC_00237]MCX5207067.1 DUF5134 domain-containing protein [Streptomyces sp. NBC_00237]